MSATAPIKHYFNPRSREGATIRCVESSQFDAFQSTLPRRSNFVSVPFHFTNIISIHAPAKERPPLSGLFLLCPDFNPRSREGATDAIFASRYMFKNFNPRSREGATIITIAIHEPNVISIHAPAKERPHQPAFELAY